MRVTGLLRLTGAIKKRESPEQDGAQGPGDTILTERELAAALLAAQGLSNYEIGVKMFISESRVKAYLTEIYRKLGIAGERDKRDRLAEVLDMKKT
jgi:DNA-binding CsgD family transcriptional regulator